MLAWQLGIHIRACRIKWRDPDMLKVALCDMTGEHKLCVMAQWNTGRITVDHQWYNMHPGVHAV